MVLGWGRKRDTWDKKSLQINGDKVKVVKSEAINRDTDTELTNRRTNFVGNGPKS